MLYIRGKLLFIHIPRTGGTSITSSLARYYLAEDPRHPMIVATSEVLPFHHHMTAKELRPYIPDWDQIHKFAVYRPTNHIIASDYRLHQRDAQEPLPSSTEQWQDSVRDAARETLDQFTRRRWDGWIGDRSAWDYWTECWPGIERYEFDRLREEWLRLCERLGIDAELIHSNGT